MKGISLFRAEEEGSAEEIRKEWPSGANTGGGGVMEAERRMCHALMWEVAPRENTLDLQSHRGRGAESRGAAG